MKNYKVEVEITAPDDWEWNDEHIREGIKQLLEDVMFADSVSITVEEA